MVVVPRKKAIILGFLTLLTITLYGIWYLKTSYFFERRAVDKIMMGPSPKITKFDYRIVLVGDSMTEYLGNLQELNFFLNRYYPDKHILLLNYGFSSTSVLSLPDRLERDTFHDGRVFQAIDKIPFNLILIESFGDNPLSEYPLSEGLKKQNEVLDKSIQFITQSHPKSSIVFVATIAPNKENYGLGAINLSHQERIKWANERSAYIENHIRYAKSHNIPVIDIYHDSLNFFGDGSLDYLSPKDHIHPSPVGVYFIDDKIAQFISKAHLLK